MLPYLDKALESLEGEVWKDVVGREGQWMVSNLGRLKSLSRTVPTWNAFKTLPTIILSQRNRNGYLAVASESVHRLVARAFIPTDDHRLYINHKNGIRIDNRAENLEWCTVRENAIHAWDTGLCNESTRAKMSAKAKLRTGSKNPCWRGSVEIYSSAGDLVHTALTLKGAAEWITQNTAYKKAGKGNISRVCNGSLSQMYGHLFRYNKTK